jgi:hypothetical protein
MSTLSSNCSLHNSLYRTTSQRRTELPHSSTRYFTSLHSIELSTWGPHHIQPRAELNRKHRIHQSLSLVTLGSSLARARILLTCLSAVTKQRTFLLAIAAQEIYYKLQYKGIMCLLPCKVYHLSELSNVWHVAYCKYILSRDFITSLCLPVLSGYLFMRAHVAEFCTNSSKPFRCESFSRVYTRSTRE